MPCPYRDHGDLMLPQVPYLLLGIAVTPPNLHLDTARFTLILNPSPK